MCTRRSKVDMANTRVRGAYIAQLLARRALTSLQGTWIPLDHGEALARRNNVYDRLQPIFEFVPGNESPPPAPRHASKPKAPKRPAVPKWNRKLQHDLGFIDVVLTDQQLPPPRTITTTATAEQMKTTPQTT